MNVIVLNLGGNYFDECVSGTCNANVTRRAIIENKKLPVTTH